MPERSNVHTSLSLGASTRPPAPPMTPSKTLFHHRGLRTAYLLPPSARTHPDSRSPSLPKGFNVDLVYDATAPASSVPTTAVGPTKRKRAKAHTAKSQAGLVLRHAPSGLVCGRRQPNPPFPLAAPPAAAGVQLDAACAAPKPLAEA
jgi:hypothetical protein